MTNAATALNFAGIFTSSTPETRPDWCDSVGTWRVSHADVLGEALAATFPELALYADHWTSSKSTGALRLWVGLREWSGSKGPGPASIARVGLALRKAGLSVRFVKDNGVARNIVITDKGA